MEKFTLVAWEVMLEQGASPQTAPILAKAAAAAAVEHDDGSDKYLAAWRAMLRKGVSPQTAPIIALDAVKKFQ